MMRIREPFANPSSRTLDVVALAASAGGVDALSRVLGDLPADFPLPILIVQHLIPNRVSRLAGILARRTSLTVKDAEEQEALRAGVVYVAPPDHHLKVDALGRTHLDRTPAVHFVRPSADTLFESLVAHFGGHVLAVILTGAGQDGAQGVALVKQHGGVVIVQDQRTAQSAGMPNAAIGTGCVDRVVPLAEIAQAIVAAVRERAS